MVIGEVIRIAPLMGHLALRMQGDGSCRVACLARPDLATTERAEINAPAGSDARQQLTPALMGTR